MIITTTEILERLEQMTDEEVMAVIDPAFDSAASFRGADPDRAVFKALLHALTDGWRADEHVREAGVNGL